MDDVKWIKITTDIFDNEKILLIETLPDGDSIIVMWFKLLCFAGKQNNSGVFMMNDKVAYTDSMLATIFRRPLETLQRALDVFESYGMIEIYNDTITIPNWEKHQNADELEKIKEQTRLRVAKHRQKQRTISKGGCNVTVTLPVTQCNATDKELDKELDKEYYNYNNSDFKAIVSAYEKNVGAITPMVAEILKGFTNELSADVIIFAIEEAVKSNVRNIRYIEGIVIKWKESNVKSIDDAKRVSAEYQHKKLSAVSTKKEHKDNEPADWGHTKI